MSVIEHTSVADHTSVAGHMRVIEHMNIARHPSVAVHPSVAGHPSVAEHTSVGADVGGLGNSSRVSYPSPTIRVLMSRHRAVAVVEVVSLSH
jgi:UDP-3-O-[3-hydroxymyristoyl] glucosamine N-acyltransferase